jgi:S1-C subfamily serine protease
VSHRLFAVVSLVALALPVAADDGLPAAVVEAVKKASVFIKVEGEGWGASGSGFVVGGDDKALHVATNHHVIDTGGKPGKATITVVFDSGTKTERSFTATVVASDSERDLAVLRLSGVKSPPAPIVLSDSAKLTETMPVYSFGFPFGKALAEDKGSPAVTVGKASVSSLRNGPDGDLATIQIDGNLNPGNSGGPVVDTKGKLVGVAVATLREGQGIGFIVPAQELGQMMQGRVGRLRLVPQKGTEGKTVVRLEASILDPLDNLRSASVRYLVVSPKDKRPEAATFARQAGGKTAELKIANGIATADIPLATTDGELVVQVTLETVGKKSLTTKLKAIPLGVAVVVGGPPPTGWKEYAPLDRTFVAWVPVKAASQSDESRTRAVNGKLLTVNSVVGETTSGLSYEAQAVLLRGAFGRAPKRELAELFRDLIAEDLKGKVTDTQEVDAGTLPGIESVIVAGRTTTRVRVYAASTGVYIASVSGSAELASTKEATTFLAAFRPSEGNVPALGGPGGLGTPGGTSPGVVAVAPKGNEPTILGGFNDPAFTDVAPDGGLLVGLEVGLAPAFGRTMTRAVRPIYRVKDNTLFGDQQGTQLDDVVTLMAKDGYAVGAVSVMHGLGFDGISVTFMKVKDGKLDPKDSYESKYVGSDEKKALTKLGGDGTPVVGIVGKSNDKDLTGFGLLLKGQEPKKK